MPTIKLYDNDPYETSFIAKVVSCKATGDGKAELVLDRTLFFPEEGGQTPDRGTIVPEADEGISFDVVDVQIRDDVITHTIVPTRSRGVTDIPAHFSKGSGVSGQIDFFRRFSNMQNHTGEHIFSGLVHSRFGYDNVGFHLSDETVSMDYSGKLTDDDIASVELAANRAIFEAHPVFCRYPSKSELSHMEYRSKKEIDGDVRIVTIEGIDDCACCAPHVRNTSEIGLLKVVGRENYKGGTRLYILCGMRALLDYSQKHDVISQLSDITSSPAQDIAKSVSVLIEERDSLRQELFHIKMDRVVSLAEEAARDGERFLFIEETNDNIVRTGVNTLTASFESGVSGIFFGNDTDGYRFIIGSSGDTDARETAKLLKEKLDARGGGKSEMVQGSVTASKDIILKTLS